MRLVREIMAPQSHNNPGSIVHALEEFLRVQRRHSICFIISDFLTVEPRLAATLQRVRRRHDVIALRVQDPAEAELPNSRAALALSDPEGTGVRMISGSRANRRRYAQAYQDHRAHIDSVLRSANCECIDVFTNQGVVTAMAAFFQRRRRISG